MSAAASQRLRRRLSANSQTTVGTEINSNLNDAGGKFSIPQYKPRSRNMQKKDPNTNMYKETNLKFSQVEQLISLTQYCIICICF